jgi:hypothetical protein
MALTRKQEQSTSTKLSSLIDAAFMTTTTAWPHSYLPRLPTQPLTPPVNSKEDDDHQEDAGSVDQTDDMYNLIAKDVMQFAVSEDPDQVFCHICGSFDTFWCPLEQLMINTGCHHYYHGRCLYQYLTMSMCTWRCPSCVHLAPQEPQYRLF